MTTPEEPTLRQKLDGIIAEYMTATGVPAPVAFTLRELQRLAEMLRDDEPPDTTGSGVGSYTVTFVAAGASSLRSVTGPGVYHRHDVPTFEREADAESMCRCLGLAFRAGQRQRSQQISLLINL